MLLQWFKTTNVSTAFATYCLSNKMNSYDYQLSRSLFPSLSPHPSGVKNDWYLTLYKEFVKHFEKSKWVINPYMYLASFLEDF